MWRKVATIIQARIFPIAQKLKEHAMRVGIIAFLQESNTFVRQPTTLRNFQQDVYLKGNDIGVAFADSHHEVGGFLAGLKEQEINPVPIFAARALPSGVIAKSDFATIMADLFAEVVEAGSCDGYLVAPHGATVSEEFSDADGYWLDRLRQMVGAAPIIGTLDPHANLSPKMLKSTDALLAYQTNPHVDQRLRGYAAAQLMAKTLRKEIQPCQGACYLPLAINIEKQCTQEEPSLSLLKCIGKFVSENPRILDASLLFGFPYADVPEMGSSVLVVTDGDNELAQQTADEIGQMIWERRKEFVGEFLSPQQALEQIIHKTGPICLLDMGDNVGGGSPADGTVLAQLLYENNVNAFVCINDPACVAQIFPQAIGTRLSLVIGAKVDSLHGLPLPMTGEIISKHDGKFEENAPTHGGLTSYDMGPTIVLKTDRKLTLMLTSQRTMPWSLQQLRTCGLDPEEFHVLVAKGVNAPLAAYRTVCREFLRVDTPGVTAADMRKLNYRQRRRPLYPFENEGFFQDKK